MTIELSESVIEAIADAVVKKMQQPKTGHWIDIMVGDMPAQVCDQCKTFYPLSYTGGGHNYCPSCGSRMVEQQEGEEE
jgi:PHP family Zn ribbon phosphoesterase